MVQAATVLMASIMFCVGLLFGLVFHLPSVSSPNGLVMDHQANQESVIRVRRELLQANDVTTNNTFQLKNAKVNTDVIQRKTSNAFQSQPVYEDTLGEISLDDIYVSDLMRDTERHLKTAAHGKIAPLLLSQNTNSNKDSVGLNTVADNNRNQPSDILIVTERVEHTERDRSSQNVTRSVHVKVTNISGSKLKLSPNSERSSIVSERSDTYRELKIIPPGPVKPQPVPSSRELTSPGLGSLIRGIYWSEEADSLSPEGFSDKQGKEWRKLIENSQILGLSRGCGRMQNRQLMLDDATQACARYRVNSDQIQGEIYSYYLSRALGISHVPPPVLLQPNPRDDRWRRIHKSLATAQWSPDKVVIVTPWVKGLEPAYIPKEFRTETRRLHPIDVRANTTPDEIRTLVQWSDLIVFDYLTANLDRVVNNMHNHQWNPDMMSSPAHNLEREPTSGLLVFLDNESGLFHSYRLLDKYNHYHKSLLKSLCVFRRTTVEALRYFITTGDIGTFIMSMFSSEEPLHRHVPRIPEKTLIILNQRLHDVNAQIKWCESHYDR